MAQEDSELAAVKARIVAARAAKKTTERTELELLTAQAEREEREAADAAALRKAQDDYGADRVKGVQTLRGIVIVKAPGLVEWRYFSDQMTNGKLTSDLLEQLVRPLVVHPTVDEFERIDRDLPGTLGSCSKAVAALAGALNDDASAKS